MSLPRPVLLAPLALAVAAGLPPPPLPRCGGPRPPFAGGGGAVTAKPTKKLGAFTPPLIIGDSVLLGAVDAVAKRGWTVNAHGCRSWQGGARTLRRQGPGKNR